MALVSPGEILIDSWKNHRLTGAFNAGNMEMVMGIIRAAEQTKTPVIMQIAEKRMTHSPLALMAPMMVNAAKQSSVPIAVQLDHGESDEVIDAAIAYGFSGIMFDGSSLSTDENIIKTKEIKTRINAWLEGEIGVLAGSEGGPEYEALYSDPAEAQIYAEQSGCDALAISIGNAHGHYKGKPKLNFDILRQIRECTNLPLVLHGGSGIPKEDLSKAVSMGICKINIATASFDALARGAREQIEIADDNNYFELSEKMVDAVYKNVFNHINLFDEISQKQ